MSGQCSWACSVREGEHQAIDSSTASKSGKSHESGGVAAHEIRQQFRHSSDPSSKDRVQKAPHSGQDCLVVVFILVVVWIDRLERLVFCFWMELVRVLEVMKPGRCGAFGYGLGPVACAFREWATTQLVGGKRARRVRP